MLEYPVSVQFLYIVAAALFVLSIKWMSEARTSRRGNHAGALGMALAIVATLMAFEVPRADLLVVALILGAFIGVPIALRLPMTAVPERTAASHAFGSLAVALVGTAHYYELYHVLGADIDAFTMTVLSAEMILGYLTFTGSCLAFLKLQEVVSGRPLVYPGRNLVSLGVLGGALAMAAVLVWDPSQTWAIPPLIVFSLIFGGLLVMGIGGADMPTVIAILNAYAGLAAAGLGFVLDNKLLIVAGALDGASGFILAIVMCHAMNRSFTNVLFGGLGATAVAKSTAEERTVQSYTPEDVATILENARSVVIAPGYGLAVAQAQHAVKELETALEAQGMDVKYAIHPVAGRMPGQMNVLLAEAHVEYDKLWEMDDINPQFGETDVAIVIGANDVTNPAAKTDPDSPLYGMPVLDVDRARTVIFIKRSLSPGFAGVDNELFFAPNTMMVFGSAKKVVTELTTSVKGGATRV